MMVGYLVVVMIVDVIVKDIDGIDLKKVLEVIVYSLEYYLEMIFKMIELCVQQLMLKYLDFIGKMGYILVDLVCQFVFYGLECVYYDFCIFRIVLKVGD